LKLLRSVRRFLSVPFAFCPLFLFADVAFHDSSTDITLESAVPVTRNNVAAWSQILRLNTHQPPVLFHSRTSFEFSDSFTQTLTQTNPNVLTRALRNVNKQKNIQCCQLKFFQGNQQKQLYSSISLCFHYFVHPSYL
jgi:hypothetical protein